MSLIFFTILHSHQGWLSEDQSHFVFGDETDERALVPISGAGHKCMWVDGGGE